MSQDQFGKPTRRTFLGTATVATAAASLTAPAAGETQSAGASNPVEPTKLARANAEVPERLMSRAKAGESHYWTLCANSKI